MVIIKYEELTANGSTKAEGASSFEAKGLNMNDRTPQNLKTQSKQKTFIRFVLSIALNPCSRAITRRSFLLLSPLYNLAPSPTTTTSRYPNVKVLSYQPNNSFLNSFCTCTQPLPIYYAVYLKTASLASLLRFVLHERILLQFHNVDSRSKVSIPQSCKS